MDSLPPWPVVQSLLLKVVLPGFGAGAGGLAAVCAATRTDRRSEMARMVGAAVAFTGGLAAGNFASDLLPWWSVEPGWPSLFPATIAAVVGGLAAHWVASRWGAGRGLVLRIAAVAGCAWWLAAETPPLARVGVGLLLLAASALNLESIRWEGYRGSERFALLAVMVPWGTAAALVLIHAHSARFFDLAVVQTATMAGVGLVAALKKVDLGALLIGPAVFFPALMLGGASNTFSEVPVASFVLVAVAPCARWSLRLPPMRRWSGRRLAAGAVIAVLIPCVVAVALAMRAETLEFGE